MPYVLTMALFVPLCCSVADIARKRLEETVPMVMLGLALGLIVMGLFGALPVAVWVLYFAWGGCVLYMVFAMVRFYRAKQWPPFLGLGFFCLVLVAAVLWWVCRGRRYANWDEFTHWGRAVKAAYHELVLPSLAGLHTNFNEYPPGVAPLQAVVMRVLHVGFREDVAIFLQSLFSASLLMYPLRRFGSKNKTAGVLTTLLMMLCPLVVYWNFYVETTVDGLLGVLFGFVLLVRFCGDNGLWERILQCLAMAMLPLVKASGLLLAALAFGVLLADDIRCGRAAKQSLKSPFFWLQSVLPLAAALASAAMWNGVIAAYGIERRWTATGLSFSSLWNLITQGEPAWRAEVVRSYFANIFADFNYGWPGGFFPYMAFFLVFAALFGLLWRFSAPKTRQQRFVTAFWALFIAGILYTLLVLGNYLFFFSEYEAVRLASLSRYLNTYIVAMLMLLCGQLGWVLPQRRLPAGFVAGGVGLGLWAVLGNPGVILPQLFSAPTYAVNTTAAQNIYTAAADAIRAVSDAEVPPVYVIAQDDIGATIPRLEYELSPRYLPTHTTSISVDVPEGELLSQRLTPEEWAAILLNDGYEYVYLFRVNNAFAAEYGMLFPGDESIVDGNMFRVVADGGSVRLELV